VDDTDGLQLRLRLEQLSRHSRVAGGTGLAGCVYDPGAV
jgi:hypothetical protein